MMYRINHLAIAKPNVIIDDWKDEDIVMERFYFPVVLWDTEYLSANEESIYVYKILQITKTRDSI